MYFQFPSFSLIADQVSKLPYYSTSLSFHFSLAVLKDYWSNVQFTHSLTLNYK